MCVNNEYDAILKGTPKKMSGTYFFIGGQKPVLISLSKAWRNSLIYNSV